MRCIRVHQLREVCVIWGHLYFLALIHDHDGQWWMRAHHADVKDISRALWLCCHSALLAQEITQCRALLCWHSVLVRHKANPLSYCLMPARHCSPVSQHTDTTACRENGRQTTLTFDCSATSRRRCCIVIEPCFALWPHFELVSPSLSVVTVFFWGVFFCCWFFFNCISEVQYYPLVVSQ